MKNWPRLFSRFISVRGSRLKKFLFLGKISYRANACMEFVNFLIYRTPLGYRWSRLLGHDFHKSTIVWFKEGEGIHTRLTLLLPRFTFEFPNMKTIDMIFELYAGDGTPVKKWTLKDVSVDKEFVIDSRDLLRSFRDPDFHLPTRELPTRGLPTPFHGSLLIKQRLHADEGAIFKFLEGWYSAASTYIEYYREGSFVTMTHDYSAWLPDQGIHYKSVGMIPAYCDDLWETHIIFHSAKPGIRSKDLKIYLYDDHGSREICDFTGLKPFAMRRVFLSELFPNAKTFLKGRVGQVVIEGIYRQLLARVAYGVVNKKNQTFSFDHCFYSIFHKKPLPAKDREKYPKGYFNPFLILENSDTQTAVIVYHRDALDYDKNLDLLVYDDTGKCVVHHPAFMCLKGNAVRQIDMRPVLQKAGIFLPFMGHGEILYHRSSVKQWYSSDLDLTAHYETRGTFANVLFGSKLWNPPREIQPKPSEIHSFGCRVVCNDNQTTWLAISNCSHDYNYKLNVVFTLDLVVNGRVVQTQKLSIKPEATIYLPLEEFFPNAREELARSQGVGLLSYTVLNSRLLATAFLTKDRKAQTLSIEHTIEVPNFLRHGSSA